MKVGKYEFDTIEAYEDAIANIDAIKNRVVYLGLSNDKHKIDVLWSEDITEHPNKWLPFAINIEDEGIHYFHDYPYLENKF